MVFQNEKGDALLRLMILMMTSDNKIHDREMALIRDIHWQLTGTELSDAHIAEEVSIVQGEQKNVNEFLQEIAPDFNDNEKELVLKAVFLVGVADGVFRDVEEETLLELAITMGVSTRRLGEIVDEVLSVTGR